MIFEKNEFNFSMLDYVSIFSHHCLVVWEQNQQVLWSTHQFSATLTYTCTTTDTIEKQSSFAHMINFLGCIKPLYSNVDGKQFEFQEIHLYMQYYNSLIFCCNTVSGFTPNIFTQNIISWTWSPLISLLPFIQHQHAMQ